MSDIYIFNEEGVINFNCCPGKESKPTSTPSLSRSGDFCNPLTADINSKQLTKEKLLKIANNSTVPSVLVSNFFYLLRCFLKGKSPVNPLEEKAFKIFKDTSPELRECMEYSLEKFDSISSIIKDKICSNDIKNFKKPISINELTQLVLQELSQRTGENVSAGKVLPDKEVAGRPRPVSDVESEDAIIPNICQINGYHIIPIDSNINKFETDNSQQFNFKKVDDKSQVKCTVQQVPEIKSGEDVIIKGYNFVDVNAKVLIRSTQNSSLVYEVQTHVYGDVNTPVTENIDGRECVIADRSVQDIITFNVPSDLPDGLYSIEVVIENNTGVGRPGRYTSVEQFIQIFNPTTRIQIVGDKLMCIKETKAAFEGFDNIGLRMLAIPIGLDGFTTGEIIDHNISYQGIHNGDEITLDRVIFPGAPNLGGLSLGIIGFKFGNDSYNKQINALGDAFISVLKTDLQAIKDIVQTRKIELTGKLGLDTDFGYGIVSAVMVAVLIFYSLWDSHKLIIEDQISLTSSDLAKLTSIQFPSQPTQKYITTGEIDVEVKPVSKDVKYIETRTYKNKQEESMYKINLCYTALNN